MRAPPILAASFALLIIPPASAQRVKSVCTDASYACILRTTMIYLDGSSRHDASAIPFAPRVRATEQSNLVVTDEAKFRSEIDGSTAITAGRNLGTLPGAPHAPARN